MFPAAYNRKTLQDVEEKLKCTVLNQLLVKVFDLHTNISCFSSSFPSYLPWFEVFYKLLNILADYTAKGQVFTFYFILFSK